MTIIIRDNLLTGREVSSTGCKSTVQFDLWVNNCLLRLHTAEEILALANWMQSESSRIMDYAQQAHAWESESWLAGSEEVLQ